MRIRELVKTVTSVGTSRLSGQVHVPSALLEKLQTPRVSVNVTYVHRVHTAAATEHFRAQNVVQGSICRQAQVRRKANASNAVQVNTRWLSEQQIVQHVCRVQQAATQV